MVSGCTRTRNVRVAWISWYQVDSGIRVVVAMWCRVAPKVRVVINVCMSGRLERLGLSAVFGFGGQVVPGSRIRVEPKHRKCGRVLVDNPSPTREQPDTSEV